MLKKWIIVLLAFCVVLSACNSPVYNQAEMNVADVKIKSQEARKLADKTGYLKRPLLVKRGMYVDTTPRSLARQPSWLSNRIIIRGDTLPFSYYSRVISSGAGNNILTKYQTGLDISVNTSLSYSGTVRGALDLLAAKTGYVYSIQYNSIYWQAFITRTFDIAFMPGSSDYLMGKASGSSSASPQSVGGGGGGGQGGGNATVASYISSDQSDSEYSNLKGTLSIWKDLDETIKALLSPDGKVMVSESTTSVTVRDRPTNVKLVGQYIYNLNHNLSKQVLIKVQILDIALQNDWNFGIDWQLIGRAFNKSPFVINGSYGTPITITALTAQQATPLGGAPNFPQFGVQRFVQNGQNPIPSYTILFNALSQQGKTSVVTEPRVVALNNQVSVVRIVNQEGYLASVQNTSLASGTAANVGTVTSQLTPGTVITGLTLYILPKILRDKIYLQVNADLSTLVDMKDIVSGSQADQNNSVIQAPTIVQKSFNQRSVIRSGDTLILSGFRQVANTANANQFIMSQALGGKGAQQLNKETIVLITPILLPGCA